MDADVERAQALLAATLTGDWTGLGTSQIEDKLRDRIEAATWHPDPPSGDIEMFAERPTNGSFVYCKAGIELPDADVKRFAQVWEDVYRDLHLNSADFVVRLEAEQPEDAPWLAEVAERAGADVAVHANMSAPTATWSWPLRVGVAANDPIASEVRGAYPELVEVAYIETIANAEVDVLLVSDDAIRQQFEQQGVRAGMVVVQGVPIGDAVEIPRRFNAFGTLVVAADTPPGWWFRLVTELAHDAPLDVAARRVPGAVLVSSGVALGLTAVRTYTALLLGAQTNLLVDLPDVTVPPQLERILEQVPFDHESGGASAVAQSLRATGTRMPITLGMPMAGPPPVDESGPATAYPRVDAPKEVTAGVEFTATIGLGAAPDPEVQTVLAGALPLSDDVLVTVTVDGFKLLTGDLSFVVNLSGQATRDLQLQAVDDAALRAERTIGVSYTVDGALRAYALRSVRVTDAQPALPGTVDVPVQGTATTEPLTPPDTEPPTLVLTLKQGDDLAGHVWQWEMTSQAVQLAAAADLRTTLDQTAQDFQATVVREGSKSSGTMLYDRLVTLGRRLADKLPDEVIDALRKAAAATTPNPPSVLLISSDGRIPWELAVIEPAIRPGASPFLCGQVDIGRWVVGSRGKPAAPPSSVKAVSERGVVVGDYAGLMTWKVLPQAKTETAALVAAGAQQLNAEYAQVRSAVHGDPAFDVLHFATHGRFLEGAREDGLVLVDRSGAEPKEVYFTPGDVEAGELPAGPFVFLNACQVGAAETILGDYAGMAAAFLRIGATAVVAPLWEVDDALAATAAADFYAAVGSGTSVGAAVRELRGRFTEAAAAKGETANYGSFLAYQYFGHPNLTLT